jgi:hypothetical protein
VTKETKKTMPAKTKNPAETPASAKPAETSSLAKPKTPAEKMAPHMYSRMLGIMRSRGAEDATEYQKDFAAYAFDGLNPENTAEVLLCSQMVATWETGMAMLSAAKSSTDFQNLTEQGTLAVKLMSLFERQFATLTKARRPPQVVTVVHEHKHIHVSTPGPTGDEIRIEGQAHATIDARTLALAPSTPLLSQDAPRDPVPVASDETRTLPNARRRTGDRRTDR